MESVLAYIAPAELASSWALAKFSIAKAISSFYQSLVRVFIDHVGSTSFRLEFRNVVLDDICIIYDLLCKIVL